MIFGLEYNTCKYVCKCIWHVCSPDGGMYTSLFYRSTSMYIGENQPTVCENMFECV